MKILKKREKKEIVVKILNPLFLFLFLLIILSHTPLIHSATTIQVPQETTPEKTGFVANLKSVFTSTWFWGGLVLFIFILILIIVAFFIIRWIVSFMKARYDIYHKLKVRRMQLAKVHSTYPQSKHFWKITKNVPIRLVKINPSGKPFISRPVCYHRGDYTTNEGNIIISFNMEGNNRFWFFPIKEVLIVPNYLKVKIQQQDKEKNKTFYKDLENLPIAKDIVQFNENEILIYAESISHAGQFYIPVLKSSDGRMIDLSLPVYQSLREVVVGDYLYIQTDEFTKIARKGIDMNPNLRYQQKSIDQNQSVEVQPR